MVLACISVVPGMSRDTCVSYDKGREFSVLPRTDDAGLGTEMRTGTNTGSRPWLCDNAGVRHWSCRELSIDAGVEDDPKWQVGCVG